MSILYTALNNILWFFEIATWAKAIIPLSDKHALLLNNETLKNDSKINEIYTTMPRMYIFCF